jgi:hypothetical protein
MTEALTSVNDFAFRTPGIERFRVATRSVHETRHLARDPDISMMTQRRDEPRGACHRAHSRDPLT